MERHCGNCAVYDRKNMKHSELCGKCVTEHFPNGKESDPSMWKPLPQTNADRIRAMSDEELAEFIFDAPAVPCDMKISAMMKENSCNDCASCIMEWLKQPTE